MKKGWLLHLALPAALAAGPYGPAVAVSSAPSCAQGPIEVSGTIHNLGSVQEEPGETPQTDFTLRKPSCGTADILVSGPAPVFCSEGERATVKGDYGAPNRFIGVPVINSARVVCDAKAAVVPAAAGASAPLTLTACNATKEQIRDLTLQDAQHATPFRDGTLEQGACANWKALPPGAYEIHYMFGGPGKGPLLCSMPLTVTANISVSLSQSMPANCIE